jgi:hypothetical protein
LTSGFGRSRFWSKGTTQLLLSAPLAMVLTAVAVAIVGVVVLRGWA